MEKAADASKVPAYFTDGQREAWQELVALVDPGVFLTRRSTCEAYALERARWLEAEAALREQGTVMVLRNDKGDVRQVVEHPMVKIAQRAQDRVLKLGRGLGL
jgi:phage terminase small subunit